MHKSKKHSKKKSAAPFPTCSHVQVRFGDYGNARGTVRSCGSKTAWVTLDAEVHTGAPKEFDHANLIALP